MMNYCEAVLRQVGAIMTNDHFVLASGRHTGGYCNKDALYVFAEKTSSLCREIARNFFRRDVEVVIGPALGGVALSQWTAHHLSRGNVREVLSIWASKPIPPKGSGFVLKRGYDKLIRGKRVLVVGDVFSSRETVEGVARAVTSTGGWVAGIFAPLDKSVYADKEGLHPHTLEVSRLCRVIAREYRNHGIEAVVGPAVGGITLSQWTAHHLEEATNQQVWAVYAERAASGGDGIFTLGPEYSALVAERNVLVVEDVLTTGGSARQVADLVRGAGGRVVGLGSLCNRGGVKAEDVGVPELVALTKISMESWSPDECPLCNGGVPINPNVGKGREFLEKVIPG